MSVWGYIRVSTEKQTAENQKLAILEFANKNKMSIDHWIDVEVSSRKSAKARRIDELLASLNRGDTLIVAELSRLGRSVGQIAMIADELVKNEIKVIFLKENIRLNGKPDMQTKAMITMFSLFAEIERDLISERTKEDLARARAEGKQPGRPKGSLGKSKLDGKETEIKNYIEKGVTKANIAKIYSVSWPAIGNFIKTRKLYKPRKEDQGDGN